MFVEWLFIFSSRAAAFFSAVTFDILIFGIVASSAWALGRASRLPKWVMRCWFGYLSAAMCRLFAYGPADATAIPRPHHLLPVIWIQTSGTGLPRLLLKRGHWMDVLVVVVVELLISKEWLSYFQVEQQHLSQIIATTGTQGGKEVFSWVVVNKCQ